MEYMDNFVYIVTWYMASFAVVSTFMNSTQYTINAINIKRPTDYLFSLSSSVWACVGVVLVESKAIVLGYENIVWSVYWSILVIATIAYIYFLIKDKCSLKSCFFVVTMYLLIGILLFVSKTRISRCFDTNGSMLNASIGMVYYCISSKLIPLMINVFNNIERNICLKN